MVFVGCRVGSRMRSRHQLGRDAAPLARPARLLA